MQPHVEAGSDPAELAHRERLRLAVGDRYELRHLIGRGGFAEVHAAWDTREQQLVAVKTLRYDVPASRAVLERFRREVEAFAKVRHPHVIPIYEVGDGDGLAYFTMPLLEGETLSSVVRREQVLSISLAQRILRETASALGAAHAAGIVHRDVKPDNIMLVGEEQRVLLMDFGVAKALDSLEDSISVAGSVVGTPFYMSPEQATRERPVDHRADQYSLAIVGYRMLTGALPFEGDTISRIIYQHVHAQPVPVKKIRPIVPASIASALERAMSKNPDDRFASMDDFSEALTRPVAPADRRDVGEADRGNATIGDLLAARGSTRGAMSRTAQVVAAVTVVAIIAIWARDEGSGADSAASPSVAPAANALVPQAAEPTASGAAAPRDSAGTGPRTSRVATAPVAPTDSTAGVAPPNAADAIASVRADVIAARALHVQGRYLQADSTLQAALARLIRIQDSSAPPRGTDSLAREIALGVESARSACAAERVVQLRRGGQPPSCP